MKDLIIIPATLDSFRSLKDKTLKLVFETQEPTPKQLGDLASNLQQFGYLAFNRDDFKQEQIDVLKNIKCEYDDKTKSKSQRLRSHLFVYWKQDNKGYEMFDDFYNYHMEKFIKHISSKLDNDTIE